jgi:hypothetical protein
MSGPRLTDHALLRVLERSGLAVEAVRAAVEASLARAHDAARALGGPDHLIVVDGLVYVVRGGDVVTVVPTGSPAKLARLLQHEAFGATG